MMILRSDNVDVEEVINNGQLSIVVKFCDVEYEYNTEGYCIMQYSIKELESILTKMKESIDIE